MRWSYYHDYYNGYSFSSPLLLLLLLIPLPPTSLLLLCIAVLQKRTSFPIAHRCRCLRVLISAKTWARELTCALLVSWSRVEEGGRGGGRRRRRGGRRGG